MWIRLGGYAGGGNCEWQAGVSGILYLAAAIGCWWACAYFGAVVGEAVGYPAAGVSFGAFGVPLLAIMINGWIDMRQDAREVKL